jgi:alpha-L-fucosidase
MAQFYQPNWNSLATHPTPQWFKDTKFGIYTHWGVYSVPAKGVNATWYPYYMYREDNDQYKYHLKTYGGPAKFGYKDFIPLFTAEKFDPDEWAEIFKYSGAQYAGPVGEHHDGFCMWDTQYSEWSAAKMGPKRDVVGQLEKAIRKQGMRFLVALHHAENWWFYPHWRKEFDTSDPRYCGLYGDLHNLDGPIRPESFFNQDRPSKKFFETWKAKILEVIDRYSPDMLWFDFGLRAVPEWYRLEMLAYYYNWATEHGQEVVVTYKDYDLAPGSGVVDLELGRMDRLTYYEWITDSTVDDGEAWGFIRDTGYKSVTTLVHYLVDNVSKNGYLLLNVGPKPDGTLPEEAKVALKGMGDWMRVNSEAIYGTTNWLTFGEGPNQIQKAGAFNEKEVPTFNEKDVRFTVKGNSLYAIVLGWPGEATTIETLNCLYPEEIKSVKLLGDDQELEWRLTSEGLTIRTPAHKPCEHAYVFKIVRGQPYP